MTLATPALPPNQFFRVTRSHIGRYPLNVQLRRKRLIGSTLITSLIASNDPTDIHDTMQILIQRLKQREANRHITTNLLGNYPPKTLENQ